MVKILPKSKKLSARERFGVVSAVLERGKSVSWACKKFGISRSFFYKLKIKYLQSGESCKQRLKALEPTKKWIRRGRQLSRVQVNEIIAVVLKNPESSIKGIIKQIYAKRHKKVVSHGGIQSFLRKLNLRTKRQRKLFLKWARSLPREEVVDLVYLSLARYKRKEPLSPEERLRAVRLADEGVPIAEICILFRITRRNFYKWQRRYHQSAPGREYQAVTDKKPVIERYYRQTPEKYEEAVLSVVAQYPEFGVAKIVKVLPEIAGQPIVGHHGVQNILRRYDLNTYEKRLAYAQVQVTPVTKLVAMLERLGIRFAVLPAPTRARIVRFASVFLLTAFSSVVFLGILGYFGSMFGQAPMTASRIGLFFASVALGMGSIFLAYSMKYYLTLGLVLSFSRQPIEEEGGLTVSLNGRVKRDNGFENGNGNGGGWLQRIFGIGNGQAGPPSSAFGETSARQAGGLLPSLDHIRLKRYPFVSIHLPFYNEKKVAERVMDACVAMDYPNYEIIVCDDSTDETAEIVQRYAKEHNLKNPNGPRIKVLHRETREGFKGGALSYAVEHMDPRTEFVVVFDADFVPYPDTLELFVKNFQANGLDLDQDLNKKPDCNIAVVGGYQWHVLNKSENWITRGVRTEYAGSYVIERPGTEILGLLKQISGSVYMIRADLLKKFGWGTSITEDFELTLKLYEQGYKVVYTPYVQAPAECVSTLKRLIRQRMRWAEGHSNNIKKMFKRIMSSSKMTFKEKLEFLYLSPYYLQAAFFLLGTFCWLLAETVFRARLPFWTSLWGWSLVLTNFFSLPLMNSAGLFLEESEERDYIGILSFVVLSYILVPFQAYASVKGFLEKQEGPWFRTPKTGKITDIFTRGRFYRWISGIIPGRRAAPAVAFVHVNDAPAFAKASTFTGVSADRSAGRRMEILRMNSNIRQNPYLALATANNRFENFEIKARRGKASRFVGNAVVTVAFILVLVLVHFSAQVPRGTLADLPIQTRVEMTGQETNLLSSLQNILVPKKILASEITFGAIVSDGVSRVSLETLTAIGLLMFCLSLAVFIYLFKRRRRLLKHLLKLTLIFLLVFSWLFSGWPVVWPLGGFDKLTTSKLGVNTIRFPPEIKEAKAVQATFVAAGTGSGVAGNVTPAYPAGLQANDIILLQVTVRDVTYTPTEPDGFDLLYGPDSTGTGRQWIYYKVSTGLESGNLTVTTNSTAACLGRMYAFRNVVTSSFTEGGSFARELTILAQSVTTSGDKRLAVSFNFVNDDNALDAFTGETGGDWTEAVAEFTTTAGSDGALGLQIATMASAGTIAQGSDDMAATDPWGVRSFGLIPAASTQVTFQAAGTGSGVAGNVTPAYPAGLQANDIILLQVTVRDTTATPTTPADFNLLYGPDSTGTGRQWIYYKVSTGLESGNLTVTTNSVNACLGRMYSFRNVVASSFTEDAYFISGYPAAVNNKIDTPAVVTTDIERLAVAFVFVNDDNAVGSSTGESDGDWAEAVVEFTTTAGSDGCLQLQTYTMTSVGIVSGGYYTMAAGDPWGVRSFALKPKPNFEQPAYRWFNNDDSTNVGTPLAGQDTAANLGSSGVAFRLRLLLHVSANQLASSGENFKLEFAVRGVDNLCDTSFSGESYSEVTAATDLAYNNNSPSDGDTLTNNAEDPPGASNPHYGHTIVTQTYEELNTFTNLVAAVPSGQDGKWDFALKDNSAPVDTTYCFRVVKSDNTVLNTYTVVPEITTVPENPLLLLILYPLVGKMLKKRRRRGKGN